MAEESNEADEEMFRQTIEGLSSRIRMDMLILFGRSSLDPALNPREKKVLTRCMEIIREFNGPS